MNADQRKWRQIHTDAVCGFLQESPGAGQGAPGYCTRSAGGEVVAAGSPGGAGRKAQGAATGCEGRRYTQPANWPKKTKNS